MTIDFQQLRTEFDSQLTKHFQQQRNTNLKNFPELADAMAYSLQAGGKRIRALLALAACRACGGDETAANKVGIAIEYLHCYSLIHDDLPALDNDDIRRGQPTLHKQSGESIAILAGDALQSLCFVTLSDIDTPNQTAIYTLIARTALVMAGGQCLDITAHTNNTDATKLETIHRNKTGALIAASLMAGGQCATDIQQSQLQTLAHMGESLGLAFQITDDLLEHSQTSEQLGKSNTSDSRNNQPTYPSILGKTASQTLVAKYHNEAYACLQQFDTSRAELLACLCDYLLQRTN